MSSFYCTFCGSYVYMSDLYQPFGDGQLSICISCIAAALREIILAAPLHRWDLETRQEAKWLIHEIKGEKEEVR